MRTLVIQIDEAGQGGGYPVRLFFDDGSQTWRVAPRAEGTLPLALPDPGLPGGPGPDPAGGAGGAGGGPSVPELLRSTLLSDAQPAHDPLGRVGAYLYGLLTAGPGGVAVAAAWEELRAAHPYEEPPQEGLLTVLDVRPAELRQLPWELLNRDGERLFADPANPCIRGRFPFRDPPAGEELGPLRLLVVVGNPDDERLAAAEELAALAAALAGSGGSVHAEELVGPSREELLERVRLLRPHVFHFIGHGRLSPGTGVPVLELVRRSDGTPWELEHDDVRNGFRQRVPRLVVLNACRTAETRVQAGVWTVAEAFVKLGAAAVVCMQGDIEAVAAVRFTGALYRALGQGIPVDQAVAAGRTAIWEETGLKRRDWALPSLHLAVDPTRVLAVRRLPADRLTALEQVQEFRGLRTFVDRGSERRTLWWGVDDPSPAAGSAGGLALVTGRLGAGKTSLTRSCLLTCSVRGRRVAQVDLGGESRKDWLQVLYTIRDGSGSSALQGGLPAGAFARFDREIAWLARGEEPPAPAPDLAAEASAPRTGPGPRPEFTAESEHAPDYIERVFTLFREALRQAAGDGVLIIALDHLSGVFDDHVTRYLAPLLLRPALEGRIGPVRLIVVLDDGEVGLIPEDLRQAAHRVEVLGFPREAFTVLLREYCARKGHPAERWAAWQAAAGLLQQHRPALWNPSDLALAEMLLSGTGSG